MSAHRSEDAQAAILDRAEAVLSEGRHRLRVLRLLHDAERLGPMGSDLRARYDRIMGAVDPLRTAA